jgi:thioredoxin-like negative regulator of GroEL
LHHVPAPTQATPREPETLRPRLLFFFSPTCGASRRTEGFLAQVLQRRGNHSTFQVVRIDADRHPDLVEGLHVTEVPALLVVSDGKVRARLSTPRGIGQIRELLAPWLR